MKRIIAATLIVALVSPASMFAQGWNGSGRRQGSGSGRQQTPGTGTGVCTSGTQSTQPLTTLSSQEIEALRFMHEEEKLARDFYTAAAAKWDLATFRSIAAAESRHFTQVGAALTRYGIDDSIVTNNPAGVFVHPALQGLYNQLLTSSQASLTAALTAAGYIEETDIADLKTEIAGTSAPDLATLYTNLMAASENHLRAIARQVSYAGGSYTAQVLSDEEVATILASSNRSGKGAAKRQRGNGAGKGTRQRRGGQR